jgi:hypothetical protein
VISISARGQASTVIEPTGAPTMVSVLPKAKRRVSRRVVVRVSAGGGAVGFRAAPRR